LGIFIACFLASERLIKWLHSLSSDQSGAPAFLVPTGPMTIARSFNCGWRANKNNQSPAGAAENVPIPTTIGGPDISHHGQILGKFG